jgi:hypothetical protein
VAGRIRSTAKFSSSGLEPATFRLVLKCLNYYATACPNYKINLFGNWIGSLRKGRVQLRLCLSVGPNRVGVSFSSSEDGKISSFRNVVLSNY